MKSRGPLKHGACCGYGHSPEYTTWDCMIARCERPNHKAFSNYGGRGIRVCRRWRDSFEAFLADMGPKPSRQHTLDRVDNTGNYEPGWATRLEQNRNTRQCHMVEVGGRIMCLREACKLVGLNYHTARYRMRAQGLTAQQSISFPVTDAHDSARRAKIAASVSRSWAERRSA